jgi:hypothetical protein
MIKKLSVLIFCLSVASVSALASISAEKRAIPNIFSSKSNQRILIFNNSALIGSNGLFVIVNTDLNGNDLSGKNKKLGDIPIGKPGTRD